MSFLAPTAPFKNKVKNRLGMARLKRRKDGEMNKLELAYAKHLEARQIAGEIDRWDYEPERLRLADRTYYVPDFRLVLNDGAIEFHDTKGGFCTDKGRLKIKVAAEQHPYKFVIVTREKGEWMKEEF